MIIDFLENVLIYKTEYDIMDYDDFTDDQKNVIEHGKGALLVEAGPGSGKTTVIVDRIKHIIKTKEENGEEVDPSSFLVITFTNKATDN